ncbi:hypothetical protein C8R45DRAFT_1217566 [Mycena sanguinolenta]|nr:hypothetical protein C8R45DRAFT_1217566 [Mycena sanguinolenta]
MREPPGRASERKRALAVVLHALALRPAKAKRGDRARGVVVEATCGTSRAGSSYCKEDASWIRVGRAYNVSALTVVVQFAMTLDGQQARNRIDHRESSFLLSLQVTVLKVGRELKRWRSAAATHNAGTVSFR